MIIIITASGCVETKESIKYHYNLQLKSNENQTQFVYFPLILTQDLVVSKISEKLEIIKGEGSFSIIETKYGFAFNITFKGDIELRIKDNKFYDTVLIGDTPQLILSMGDDANDEYPNWGNSPHKYYIYQSGNDEVQIDFQFDINSQPSDFDGIIQIQQSIKPGWTRLEAYKEAGMI